MEASRNRVQDAVLDAIQGVEGDLAAALFALEPTVCMRRLPGRETFLVDLDDPCAPVALDVDGDAVGRELAARLPVVVKRFAASDGKEARSELLHGRLPRSCAQREAENLSGLLSLGLPVPAPLFWCESGAASLVLIEYLPHRFTLRGLLEAGAPESQRLVEELAVLVARLHSAGWYHRDLYLEHVVVLDAEDRLALLDAGRARRAKRPRSRWFVKDLAALSSSAPIGADRLRLRFLAHYFAALATERGAPWSAHERRSQRRLMKRVARRAERMRAHVPRHQHQAGPSMDTGVPLARRGGGA